MRTATNSDFQLGRAVGTLLKHNEGEAAEAVLASFQREQALTDLAEELLARSRASEANYLIGLWTQGMINDEEYQERGKQFLADYEEFGMRLRGEEECATPPKIEPTSSTAHSATSADPSPSVS